MKFAYLFVLLFVQMKMLDPIKASTLNGCAREIVLQSLLESSDLLMAYRAEKLQKILSSAPRDKVIQQSRIELVNILKERDSYSKIQYVIRDVEFQEGDTILQFVQKVEKAAIREGMDATRVQRELLEAVREELDSSMALQILADLEIQYPGLFLALVKSDEYKNLLKKASDWDEFSVSMRASMLPKLHEQRDFWDACLRADKGIKKMFQEYKRKKLHGLDAIALETASMEVLAGTFCYSLLALLLKGGYDVLNSEDHELPNKK